MKRISFDLLAASVWMMVSLIACQKEGFSPVPASGATATAAPTTLHLVADNWVNYGGEVYVNTFPGILASANANGSRTILVYVMTNGKEIQINHSTTTYMGYPLWATSSPTDLVITCRCSAGKLPFTSLNLRVVIQ